MIQEYGERDQELFQKSFHTVWSCRRVEKYAIINATDIYAVVGMIPHPRADGQLGSYDGQVFVVEKIGLDVMPLIDNPRTDDDDGEEAFS